MALRALSAMLLTLVAPSVIGETRPDAPPDPPPFVIPAFDYSTAASLCVGCEEPFDFTTHEKANSAIVASTYIAQLRRAMYVQDTLHQFESKAHFDNCDFGGAAIYLDRLWNEIDSLIAEAKQARSDGDEKLLQGSVRNAFFKLGQMLHAVQDFYAHSNYVEMQISAVDRVIDIPIIRPWRRAERGELKTLMENGLVSGRVFWGIPKKCAASAPSHRELAKDTPQTTTGAQRIAKFEHLSLHRIALILAREASFALVKDAFTDWPLLKQLNGQYVGFEIFVDRRTTE